MSNLVRDDNSLTSITLLAADCPGFAFGAACCLRETKRAGVTFKNQNKGISFACRLKEDWAYPEAPAAPGFAAGFALVLLGSELPDGEGGACNKSPAVDGGNGNGGLSSLLKISSTVAFFLAGSASTTLRAASFFGAFVSRK